MHFFGRLLEERDITLYCDLHGHSRKQNVFIYGCENRFDPLKRLRERIFPVMISKNAPTKVNFVAGVIYLCKISLVLLLLLCLSFSARLVVVTRIYFFFFHRSSHSKAANLRSKKAR